MPLAAFVAWLVTAGGGLCLAAIWLIEYDPSGAPTRLPKTVVTAHGLLALAGLYVWWEYVSTEKSGHAGRPNPVPPERHLPLPLVIAHGVLAMATIGLVLLAALDIGGN